MKLTSDELITYAALIGSTLQTEDAFDPKLAELIKKIDENIPFFFGVDSDIHYVKQSRSKHLTADAGELGFDSTTNLDHKTVGNEYIFRIGRYKILKTRKTVGGLKVGLLEISYYTREIKSQETSILASLLYDLENFEPLALFKWRLKFKFKIPFSSLWLYRFGTYHFKGKNVAFSDSSIEITTSAY